jgi:hypothetical protein
MRRVSQWFLQLFFVFGLAALILTCFVLAGCANQVQRTPQQVKIETDFANCVSETGVRGTALTSVAPDGAWKSSWGPGEGGWAARKDFNACLRAKGHTIYDGPGPAR